MKIKNWMKVLLVLVLIAFVFSNPFLRSIVHLLLPLGSGVDDIVEIIALIAIAVLLFYKIKNNWIKIIYWFKDDDYDF